MAPLSFSTFSDVAEVWRVRLHLKSLNILLWSSLISSLRSLSVALEAWREGAANTDLLWRLRPAEAGLTEHITDAAILVVDLNVV